MQWPDRVLEHNAFVHNAPLGGKKNRIVQPKLVRALSGTGPNVVAKSVYGELFATTGRERKLRQCRYCCTNTRGKESSDPPAEDLMCDPELGGDGDNIGSVLSPHN